MYTQKQKNLDTFRYHIKPYAEKVGLKVVRVTGGWEIRNKKKMLFQATFYDSSAVANFLFGYETAIKELAKLA